MRDWRHLKGKQVVVTAGGVQYRGKVIELGERNLLLRADGGHREIPWERITRMQPEGPAAAPRGRSILG